MARIIRAALTLGASLVALISGTAIAYAEGVSAAPIGTVDETVVQLQVTNSDFCLAAANKNGARAGLDLCVTDWQSQLWRIIPVDSSSFELRSVPSGRCLEVENSGTKAGSAVQVWDCTGGKQMRWQLVLVDHAQKLYQLRPTHTEDRCLDIVDGNVQHATVAQSWYCNQTAAQLWRIKLVERPTS